DIPEIYEFEDVAKFLKNVNNDAFKEFSNLEDIRNFYLNGRRQIHTYLYQDFTWFSGIFNHDAIETAEDELHLDSPVANFVGWKISKKSKFARNSDIKIFNSSLKLSDNIITKLKQS